MGAPLLTRRSVSFLSSLLIAGGAAIARADAPAPATSQSASTPATSPSASTQSAATTTVKRGTLQLKFDATAYLEPVDPVEVRIRPKVYAAELTITAIAANGASVKKGETLLEIDPAALKRQLEAAQSEATVARANVVKAEADAKLAKDSEALALRMQKDAVTDADDAVKWWDGVDGPLMIKQTEMARKQFYENVEDRTDELDQLKKMYKSEELTNATADIVVKRAIRGLDYAKFQAEAEDQHADKAETYTYPISKRHVYDSLTQTKQALASLLVAQAQAKVVRQAGLVSVHAALAAADKKLAELRGDLEQLAVSAPADGIVWYGAFSQGNWQGGDPKALKVGEKIAAQQTVMTLYTPGKLRAVADLSEAKYYSVPAGTKAVLRPSAFPELRIDGTCAAAPRTALMTQNGPIYPMPIQTAEVDARLIPGMRGSVQIQVPPLEKVVLVPTATVVDSAVWVVEKEGVEHKRPVVTGRSDGKSIEILSGVKEGDKVLAQGKQS